MDAAQVAANIRGKLNQTESTARVNKYRKAMQDLDIVQVNYLIPEDRSEEMRLIADKMRAEHFVKLSERDVDDQQRIMLANRNSARYPTYAEIGTVSEQIPEGNPLRGELRKLKEHVGAAMRADGALQATTKEGGEDVEFIKWSSLAVAHAHMAKYHMDYIRWHLEQTG